MKRFTVFFLVVLASFWVCFQLGATNIPVFVAQELGSLLKKISLGLDWSYRLPLFDCRDQMIGEVVGYRGARDVSYEFVFVKNQLIGIGLGEYLSRVLGESKRLAHETLVSHFGDRAKVLDTHLTYINPISFWIRIIYNYGDKVLNDLYLKGDSLRFTLAECEEKEMDWGSTSLPTESLPLPKESFSWVEVRHDFPFWEYYLSSFSNAVVTLADYWKEQNIIKIPIYPDDPDFLLTNVHLMMQDVEMLRRKCACEQSESGVSAILEKFINARGGSVRVVAKTVSLENDFPSSIQEVERLIRLADQPFLFEWRGSWYTNYGIAVGYVCSEDGFFISSLLPVKSIDGTMWKRYLFRLIPGHHLRIYEISTESGE
ncbi:MAG: hypothetical protein HPY68_07225 [Candidatus Atribacteria bacterium]|nr:hypothetical protein [Candidatus Atribacteria bacterium]